MGIDMEIDIAELDTESPGTVRYTFGNNKGGRNSMKDRTQAVFCNLKVGEDEKIAFSWALFGMFDEHGGKDAAIYAQNCLLDHIIFNPDFDSNKDDLVCKSIKDSFVSLHNEMTLMRTSWPKSTNGHPALCGTMASVALIKNGKLYIPNVGDSAIVLGCNDPSNPLSWTATQLTNDHKPDSPLELKRIEEAGGTVVKKGNVERVVWNYPKVFRNAAKELIQVSPREVIATSFRNMGRALGDFWSWNEEKEKYIVSPVPDTQVITLDPEAHRCLILGSAGLWNMISKLEAVNTVYCAEMTNARRRKQGNGADVKPRMKHINPAEKLVRRALDEWKRKKLRADNLSVIAVALL